MLEAISQGDIFHAPFGRAQAGWIGTPKGSPLVGLTITTEGEVDAISRVPIKQMMRLRPHQALRLLSSLLDALSQTECNDEMKKALTPYA